MKATTSKRSARAKAASPSPVPSGAPVAARLRKGSTEWWEWQYDNRGRVPDAAAHLARWAAASALTRERMTALLDEPYGESPAERLDVFPPLQPGSPILVFLHGGYWRALDKSDHSFVAPAFVQAGAAVVVPNYGLCPAVTVDEIALQCARALAWVWREAERFGGDRRRIVVVGHSAGGHLAAMLAACRWPSVEADLPPDLVSGTLALSGLFDLAPLRQVPSLQKDLRLAAASDTRLSPSTWPAPRGPVAALVGALESEAFVEQSRGLQTAWGRKVVPLCQAVPQHNHFSIMTDLADPTGRSHAVARKMLGLPAVPSAAP